MYTVLLTISSICTMFFIGNNGCYEHSKKHSFALFLYLTLTACVIGIPFGQWVTFFYVFGFFVFAVYKRQFKLLNIFGILYGYIMAILADYLSQAGIFSVFHISVSDMTAAQYLLSLIFYLPYIYLVTRFSHMLLFRVIKLQNFYQNSLVPVYLLNLFLCFAILALNILYGDYVNYPPEMIHFCILLFGCYFLCNNLLFFLIYRVTKKEAQLQQQLHDQEQLAVYTKELEKINQSFRSFKHDYMNILLTMDEYLKTRQYDALTSYFRKQILPAGCGLNEVHAQISVLSNLQIPEIKGLLIGKCNYAISKNLRLQLTIPFSAYAPAIDIVALARILGIFLDNAIEGAQCTEESKLEIYWYAYETKTIIIIRNSCSASTPTVQEIQQRHFSIRKGHEGIGLCNVRQLLKKSPNIYWIMKQENHMFHQELRIYTETTEKNNDGHSPL